MSANDNLRLAALESLKRTTNQRRALASFVSKLQSNKVLLAALAEPYLNSVAETMVPVKAHVRSTPDHQPMHQSGPTSAPRRGLDVIGAIGRIVRKSVFDSYLLPDGRSLRKVRWGELPGLVDRWGKASRVLAIIMQHGTVTVDTGQYVSDVVGENVVLDAIAQVEGAEDVAA